MNEEGEHGMVLRGLEWHPNVHLLWLSPLCREECSQLIDLLVVLDDWSETLCHSVFAECAEVLAQEVLWHEAWTCLLYTSDAADE